MVPGTFTVQLNAGGSTVSQQLEVAMDPRVETTVDELAALLEFQNEVAAALARVVDLADNSQEEGGPTHDEARSIARVLTSLASDLESSDALPTAPQRALFNQTVCALRFFYHTTLGKDWMVEHIPYPRSQKKLPTVLSADEDVHSVYQYLIGPEGGAQ